MDKKWVMSSNGTHLKNTCPNIVLCRKETIALSVI